MSKLTLEQTVMLAIQEGFNINIGTFEAKKDCLKITLYHKNSDLKQENHLPLLSLNLYGNDLLNENLNTLRISILNNEKFKPIKNNNR